MSHQLFPSAELHPDVRPIKIRATSSPRVSSASATSLASDTPTSVAARKIAIAGVLSDESAYAVKWVVDHYLRSGDAVVLLHVRPTSILSGADWGSVDIFAEGGIGGFDVSHQKLEEDFDAFTSSKAADLAQPLVDAQVSYKIHNVKDHDMRERLCLEVGRLRFHALIMGSRGFGALRRGSNGRLGSVSNYCVRHCVFPMVVVRYPFEKDGNGGDDMFTVSKAENEGVAEEEYHVASDGLKGLLYLLLMVFILFILSFMVMIA